VQRIGASVSVLGQDLCYLEGHFVTENPGAARGSRVRDLLGERPFGIPADPAAGKDQVAPGQAIAARVRRDGACQTRNDHEPGPAWPSTSTGVLVDPSAKRGFISGLAETIETIVQLVRSSEPRKSPNQDANPRGRKDDRNARADGVLPTLAELAGPARRARALIRGGQ
jgi:hypothetical protein